MSWARKTDVAALRPYSPRISQMTTWSRHDPVMLPQGYPDHWAKMKVKCTSFQVALPSGKIVGNADERTYGAQENDKVAVFRYQPNGNLTPEVGRTFSEVLTRDLHGNLPGSYDYGRPKSRRPDRESLRSSYSTRAKEGFPFWQTERPKPTTYGRYTLGSSSTVVGT